MPYHCGICDDSFDTKGSLKQHIAHHPDVKALKMHCAVCKWPFSDQLALEAHQRTSQHFDSPDNTGTATIITCDRCSRDFTSQKGYNKHRSWPNGSCADFMKKKSAPKKQGLSTYVNQDRPAAAVETPTLGCDDVPAATSRKVSDDKIQCGTCQNVFRSMRQFSNHSLRCQSAAGFSVKSSPSLPSTSPEVPSAAASRPANGPLEIQDPPRMSESTSANTPRPTVDTKLPPKVQAPLPSAANAEAKYHCQKPGCGKVFRSAPALKVHDGDMHGVGGRKLDLHGRDAWMLGQRERERWRGEGLLRGSPGAVHGRGGRQGQKGPRAIISQGTMVATASNTPLRPQPHNMMSPPGPTMPIGTNDGGPADMEQARLIQGKVLRLLIQSDIFITNRGKITACGIDWVRIGTSSQREVVGMIEDMIYLRRALQHDQYLAHPKAFTFEHSYDPREFMTSPARDHLKPGLGAIALGCAKVLLADGAQDIVKIAAVDLVTGRILMNHLVCTSPDAAVADWRSASTGLFAWRDMEHARSYGYKVLKRWDSARSALHKFIDQETIIVGHNLRPDLDALRMVHGRAIDVVKVYEKYADGPLSKTQLGLDSLIKKHCNNIQLKDDPEYGRDVLMNAFATREFLLLACKNKKEFAKIAKQTSLDLQRAGLTA